jgi:EAL domain-containing protein (putative c-di-GMP-specific phosphodiesterase class I)
MDPELLGMIASALSESGLPPEGLVLEVTESALMSDAIDAKEILRSINDMGIGLAIDDFGTGHSSLAQLKRFPVRILKIDKAFIDGVASFELDAAIVNTIVQLGSTFGLRVVAEGVETKEQLDKVAELGCDYYQGYLLSRPTPQSEVVFTP